MCGRFSFGSTTSLFLAGLAMTPSRRLQIAVVFGPLARSSWLRPTSQEVKPPFRPDGDPQALQVVAGKVSYSHPRSTGGSGFLLALLLG
jgi:hypothetical protein